MGSSCCKSSSLSNGDLKTFEIIEPKVETNIIKKTTQNNPQENESPQRVLNKFDISILLNTLDQNDILVKNSQDFNEQDLQSLDLHSINNNFKHQPFKLLSSVQNSSVNLTRQNIGNSFLENHLVQKKNKVRKPPKIGPEIFVTVKYENLLDHYTIGKVIGKGSYGLVREVTHKKTGIVRAMKQIKIKSLEEDTVIQEMKILRTLDHPNIVKLYELFQDKKYYYLITEYLNGGELFQRIQKMNYFSERMASRFMRQILSAVTYCHEKNIVHRDLKPENILFNGNDYLKIIDFGTSRKFDPKKKMDKLAGTSYYIAPEVIKEDYDEKCDVWSCGIIMYILLCGYPPFFGRTDGETIQLIKDAQLIFDPKDWRFVSDSAKQLIKKLLTADPGQRISARQALNDEWIQKYSRIRPDQCQVEQPLNNMRLFTAETTFKRVVLIYIVRYMSTQSENLQFQQYFCSIDHDNDGRFYPIYIQGKISKDELLIQYNLLYNDDHLAKCVVDKIFNEVDINRSGQVDFSEFLLAAMDQETLLSDEKVEQAFNTFDADGDGEISQQEMTQIFSGLGQEQMNVIFKELGHGSLTKNQFLQHLTKSENL